MYTYKCFSLHFLLIVIHSFLCIIIHPFDFLSSLFTVFNPHYYYCCSFILLSSCSHTFVMFSVLSTRFYPMYMCNCIIIIIIIIIVVSLLYSMKINEDMFYELDNVCRKNVICINMLHEFATNNLQTASSFDVLLQFTLV